MLITYGGLSADEGLRAQAHPFNQSYLDVDDVAELVGLQVGGQVFNSLLLEGAREHVARSAPVTFRVRHLESSPENETRRVEF